MTKAISNFKSVMIVDDDEFSQELLRRMFVDWELMDIHLAADGLEAMHALGTMAAHPDLLICDIFMPKMDGLEFIGELVKLQFQGGLVLISGVNQAMLGVAQTIATHNGLCVLAAFAKPIQSNILLKALTRA